VDKSGATTGAAAVPGGRQGGEAMFEGWSDFYLLLGTASGALIGLLFVVTTLTAEMRAGAEQISQGAAFYMTPTLFHYVTVLVLSVVSVVPGVSGLWVAVLLGPWALVGAIYSAVMAVLVRRSRQPDSGHSVDVWCYGVLPALMYLGMIAAAWLAWRDSGNAPYALGIGLVVLMIIGIRNSWDLVTFIAPRAAAAGGEE
jgi:hypothetical protein